MYASPNLFPIEDILCDMSVSKLMLTESNYLSRYLEHINVQSGTFLYQREVLNWFECTFDN